MELFIRADASSDIGSGHVFRTLGLADELRPLGWTTTFACREARGHLIEVVRSRGYDCVALPAALGADGDADACLQALQGRRVDRLLVDHYGLDARWERRMRPSTEAVTVIDDLADRPHDCDLLFDSSRAATDAGDYDGLVPDACRRCVGHEYVPLRREFFEIIPPERDFSVARRVLVTLGGNDPDDLTSRVLDAAETLPQLTFDVTAGLSNPRLGALQRRAARMDNVTLHAQHPRPSELMLAADLCLGAGGQTAWERCYLGLPSLVLILADNQRPVADRLAAADAIRVIGDTTTGGEAIAQSIAAAAADPDWRRRSSDRGRALVDGRGLSRMVEALTAPLKEFRR